MQDNLSDKARAFLAKNPTLIGRVLDHSFYEDPQHGDEAPMIMITPEGKLKRTEFWDLPSAEELFNA
jgi:hypothetical protein